MGTPRLPVNGTAAEADLVVGVTDTATLVCAGPPVSPTTNLLHGPRDGECVYAENALPPEALDEIASLLAKGFLRYWKSQHQRPLIAQSQVDSPAPESRHVNVVNAAESEKN